MANRIGIINVQDIDQTTPPVTPTEGLTWHTGQTPDGAWTGKPNRYMTYVPGIGGTGGGANDWLTEPVAPQPFAKLATGDGHLMVHDGTVRWYRLTNLAGFFATKTAAQALTTSFTDIVTWATGAVQNGITFNTTTGVATIDRAIDQLDVDINIKALVTATPAGAESEFQLLKNGVLVSSCKPWVGESSPTSVRANQATIHATLYSLTATDTLRIQGLHIGTSTGASSVSGDCCQWRMREVSQFGM